MMKRCIFSILLFLIPLSSQTADKLPEKFEEMLRGVEKLDGWQLKSPPQYAAGDDLFTLINGGAEIYHEYGFNKAVIAQYTDGKTRSFNLELYEMSNENAAYGIYTFKVGKTGRRLDIDGENKFEDYYLNLRKGRYLLTIVALKVDNKTIKAMVAAARKISQKISQKSTMPQLVCDLKNNIDKGVEIKELKYLKGHLALFNFYDFDTRDLFDFREGVAVRLSGFTLYVFKYDNKTSSLNSFQTARSILKKNSRYKKTKVGPKGAFVVQDENDLISTIEQRNAYIFILQSRSNTKYYSIFKKICDKF